MATAPISDTGTRDDYTATASQTIFPYTFWIKEKDHLDVYQNNVLLTLNTDYTVSDTQIVTGANVVLTAGATNGDAIAIVYNPDVERQTEFQTSGDFTANAVNLEFSYIVSLAQWLKSVDQRTIRLADDAVSTASLTITAPDSSAGKVVRVNATGDGYDYVSIADSSTVSNYETETFDGDGATDTFTLTAFTPLDAQQIEVVVDNQTQYPTINYTVSGDDVVFESGSIPASGTDNIFVRNISNGSTTTTPADSSVSTVKLQNNAVTTAKIDSDFITDYTSGTLAATDEIAFADVDDSNTVKKTTAQDIADFASASGGLVLLSTASASNDTSIDFTSGLDSTYEKYIFDYIDLIPATDGADLYIRTDSSAGASFDSGVSDYRYTLVESETSIANINSSGAAQIFVHDAIGSASGEGCSGTIELFNPAGTAQEKVFGIRSHGTKNNGATNFFNGVGIRSSTAIVNAVRFIMSTGNITSGEFKLYGVKKS